MTPAGWKEPGNTNSNANMKPRPFTSVLDMLSQGDKAHSPILPYDTYAGQKADFITFAIEGRFIAFPSRMLGKARLGDGATSIILDFGRTIVSVSGKRLEELFEEILLGRIRVIRTGKHPLCAVDAIYVCEAIIHVDRNN